MQGWNQRALDQEAHHQRVVEGIRRKWGVAPALTVEFVAYYHDRCSQLLPFVSSSSSSPPSSSSSPFKG